MITKLISKNFIKFIFISMFMFVFTFSRSFMGVFIFKFRIGEIAILISLLLLFLYLTSLLFGKDWFSIKAIKGINFILYSIVLFFIFNSLISNSSFLDTYTYKSSSYIWALGFLILGMNYFHKNTISDKFIITLMILLFFIYFVAIYDLPIAFQNFVLSFSDKYEPHKGSDLVLFFISSFYLFNRRFSKSRIAFEVFLFFSSIYIPLLLFKSRAGFISLSLFVLFEFLTRWKLLRGNLLRNIILFALITLSALQSTFLISESGFIKFEKAQESVEYVTDYRLPELREEEFFKLFFIKNQRLYSSDVNLNWRLQIWQDVIFDINDKSKHLVGYGYKNKIPAMSALDFEGNSVRSGLDGLNENVHNFFVNIYARGGLIHLFLYLSLFVFLIKKNEINLNLLIYVIPLLITSSFDASMENSHFPLIFYFFCGAIYSGNFLRAE